MKIVEAESEVKQPNDNSDEIATTHYIQQRIIYKSTHHHSN